MQLDDLDESAEAVGYGERDPLSQSLGVNGSMLIVCASGGSVCRLISTLRTMISVLVSMTVSVLTF